MSQEDPEQAGLIRGPGLEVNDVADGLLVYRAADDTVHHLNASAAVVFELCDGRPREALRESVGRLLDLPRRAATAMVDRAIEELAQRELIRDASA